MPRITNTSVMLKIMGAGIVTAVLLLVSIGLAGRSFAAMVGQAEQETAAHRLTVAVSTAYQQWTLDDDQSNMYAAVAARRDPAQRQLAETTYQQAAQARATVTPALAEAQALATSAPEAALLRRIQADLVNYDTFTRLLRQQALAGNVTRAIHVVTVENLAPFNALPLAFADLEARADAKVAQANSGIAGSADAGNRLLLLLALGGILALVPSVLIGRAIARPLGRLTDAAGRLAVGDMAVTDTLPRASRDELGRLSAAFRAIVTRQQEMAGVAEAIAAGDLTRTVAPKDAADTLGRAFADMTANLRALIGEVAGSSGQVAGVREMAAGAQRLAELAAELQATVARFRLDEADDTSEAAAGAPGPVRRRRAADWVATGPQGEERLPRAAGS